MPITLDGSESARPPVLVLVLADTEDEDSVYTNDVANRSSLRNNNKTSGIGIEIDIIVPVPCTYTEPRLDRPFPLLGDI